MILFNASKVVLYFNDVMEGGETVFTHAPGIDHHLVPDTKVPVREVRDVLLGGTSGVDCLLAGRRVTLCQCQP